MRTVLITGGAGFIGVNAAKHFLEKGDKVIVLDNLSRKGSESNLDWLKGEFPKVKFEKVDIREFESVKKAFKKYKKIDVIIHLAAQVAVTTSVLDPLTDMQINVVGTFNVLEATRQIHPDAIFLFASTNKVYGGMERVKVVEKNGRYAYQDYELGVPERETLDFHSPYGCSKGAADQYVRDYHRIYGLKTVVFRQSCIYGYRQFGVEDQGWVAWFNIAAHFNRPITVYGDGKQVRDVLFVTDLVAAYDAAIENIDKTAGRIYNMGGGADNQMSILELIAYLEQFYNKKINYTFADWRPGDQKVFVADISKAKKQLAWQPEVNVAKGVENLFNWITTNDSLFKF
jgi:CDP-paratose 2-epimerase